MEIIDGKYQVDALLGRGGMGAVYRATHLGTRRTVALKLIAPQFMRNPELLARFQREAEAAGRLRHLNVVNVTDFGIVRDTRHPAAYLAMEYLDGETLQELVTRQGPLPALLGADIIEQIALGVHHAHSQNILHRDLKPQNIWLQPDGRGGYLVKVLDFGIAKLTDAADTPIDANNATADPQATQSISGFTTSAGSTLGTPAYMSPEQCLAQPVSAASDIYALGLVAYFALAAKLPFSGTAADFIRQHVHQAPTAPAIWAPAVQQAVLKALKKNPSDRPPSTTAFAASLRAAIEGPSHILRRSRALSQSESGAMFYLVFLASAPLLAAIYLSAMTIPALLPLNTALGSLGASILAEGFTTIYRDGRQQDIAPQRAAAMALRNGLLRSLPALAAFVRTVFSRSACLTHLLVFVDGLPFTAAREQSRRLLLGHEQTANALLVRRYSIAAITGGIAAIFATPQVANSWIVPAVLQFASFQHLFAWPLLLETAWRTAGLAPRPSPPRAFHTPKPSLAERHGTLLWLTFAAAIIVLAIFQAELAPLWKDLARFFARRTVPNR